MTITAKVIEDSISPHAPRLTTFQLKYPRFIHAEFMTHRVFSRNASSSRAIPVQKQIDMIREDTAMPSHWGKNQSGMQAEEENDAFVEFVRHGRYPWDVPGQEKIYNGKAEVRRVTGIGEDAWLEARDRAIEVAQAFHDAGYHKQIVNRILEPFSHISVVCTATDYENFFWLRRHKDAQPEIKILADAMAEALDNSTPRKIGDGEWHLPYVSEAERDDFSNSGVTGRHFLAAESFELSGIEALIRISVARCARVSYLTHDGNTPSIENDLKLYDRLVGSSPLHASPAEHQATPDEVIWNSADLKEWGNSHLHGNLVGYKQFRKMLDGEHVSSWEGLNDFSDG